MKKLIYSLAVSTMTLIACESQPTYKITGTSSKMVDSTIVYLQKVQERRLVKLDSAMVIGGKFTFNGRQDTAAHRYVTGKSEGVRYRTDFFLENGQIAMILDEECSVTGTPLNDAYHAFINEHNILKDELQVLYKTRLETEEQKQEIRQKFIALQERTAETIYNHIELNIANHLGAYMFPEYADYLSNEQQKALLDKMPESFKSDKQIIKISQRIEILDKTAVGKTFTDFSMPDAKGNPTKLSDFVSKNKYTLVDFWASWCAPCRAEMPHVIDAYKKYSNKGFGVVGISLDNDEKAWKKAITDLKMPWSSHMSDLKGFDNEAATLYGINAIPATVLIDQDGTIIARDLRGKALDDKLAELLK